MIARRPALGLKLLATIFVLGLVGVVAGTSTWSAFKSFSNNPSNTFNGGAIAVSDNDGGSTAMFTLSSLYPEQGDTGCIEVTYTGSYPVNVRLHGVTTGTGLDQYVDLIITKGTIATPTFDSCTGFTADATNYKALGAGIVYQDTLQAFGDSYAAGLVDPGTPTPTDESWTTGEKHVYRVQLKVQANAAARNKNLTQTFKWEARSS